MFKDKWSIYKWSIVNVMLLLVCCEKQATVVMTKEAVIAEEVDKRIAKHKQALIKRCNKELLEDANAIVDSILIANARLQKDTLNRPEKIDKPSKPKWIPPSDSTRLKPLFLEESTSDSVVKKPNLVKPDSLLEKPNVIKPDSLLKKINLAE